MVDLLSRAQSALGDRYGIERELGRGGMAVVYLAEDLKHHRRVAIKILKPELSQSLGTERFLREIEIAAQLTHPHILPLHDSGEAGGLIYYVMPYIEGESLRDRLNREKQLPLEDTVRIVRDVADAVAYAHGMGVIHRDIKPENILLSAGRAVVSDFGIARAIDAAGTDRLTESGLALGTPAYMSPEQTSSDETLDGRSDIYSLGCVAYEMLGGQPPFTGPSPQAVLARHSVDPVPHLRTLRQTVSADLQRAVERALAKVPADRFRTAAQFAETFERAAASDAQPPASTRFRNRPRALAASALLALLLSGGGWWIFARFPGLDSSRIASLVVLPLENLTQNPDQEYFVAGMHDALIGELARIGALRVISRTSAMRYKNSGKSVPEIARELNVDAVVEASVLRAGDSVQIRAQLIRALPQEEHLWAQAYQRDIRDVLAIHGDVARAIAQEIKVTLTPQEQTRLAGSRRVNPETYEAYLRGMFHLNQFTPEGFEKGLAYLHEAVTQDPDDPLANAGLALGFSLVASHSPTPPPNAFEQAKAAAVRALELDESMAEAHGALAEIKLYRDWDWAGAERAFRSALELNPSLAPAHAHYAWYLNLVGRQDEAVAEMKRAQQVDPLTPLWQTWLGDILWSVGRYHEAIAPAKKALELNPDFPWAFLTLGIAYAGTGMYDEAIAAHRKAVAANPEWSWALGQTLVLAGRSGEARKIVADLERENTPMAAFGLVTIYTALGDKSKALRWAEAAYRLRHPWAPWFSVISMFEPLWDDPRFEDLRRRMNLSAIPGAS
jgi:eukaryotic-like serine/threonine-protein kinase